jgi:hypothetical protein
VNPRYEMTKLRPPSSILELNHWLEAFCKQRHYTYVDYFSQMVDPGGYMKADLADDGLHPNPAGYRVMGPIAMDAIEHNVGRPVPAPPPAITSASRKRVVTKAKPPKPEPVQTAQAPAPAARKPAPAPARPAPVTTPAPKPTADPKPVEKTDDAAKQKKKKESFWKRTYPSTPPPQ